MSAGAFTRSFYTTNAGNVVPIRVQPETLQATIGGVGNLSAGGPATAGFPSATVSGSRRGIGIHPRTVTLTITGAPPTGYKLAQSYTIPVVNQAAWDAAITGTVASYLGAAAEVLSANPERIK